MKKKVVLAIACMVLGLSSISASAAEPRYLACTQCGERVNEYTKEKDPYTQVFDCIEHEYCIVEESCIRIYSVKDCTHCNFYNEKEIGTRVLTTTHIKK